MAIISVELNPDRTQGGLLRVVKSNGQQEGVGLSVLGKAAFNDAAANGNPTANQLLPYGDTPTGEYQIISITNGAYYGRPKSYGPDGVIKLQPTSGNAATAAANGRKGLLVHGGDLWTGGQLKRTNGCLRLRNDEFLYLKNIILALNVIDPVNVLRVFDNGTNSINCGSNASCGDGDPPPGF